jgi:glutamate:GABA antiporter
MSRGKISFLALTLLIISAVDSNRNLPSSALFGSPLIFYFLFGAVFFLFPSALVSAELSATFPEEGGIYFWVKEAFGKNMGFLAVWLQWVNTVAWYPTILTFIAGVLTYLFDPELMEHKWYMISVIVGLFWLLTIANLFGISASARLNTIFSLVGTIIPMLLLIVLGFCWIGFGWGAIQISFGPEAIFPSLAHFDTWTALVAVMGSFLGMELSGVHIAHIPHPQKIFPRALAVSSLYILATMLFGSLMIAVVLPSEQINLAGGLMQVFAQFFKAFHLEGLVPLMTLLIVIGSFGGMINWLISPAKGLQQAAKHGFLSSYFTQLNRHHVAGRILIAQAVLVTVISIVVFAFPSINGFYWFLAALSNCLYMVMYILLFLSAYRLRKRPFTRVFQVPGGIFGMKLIVLCGLIGASATILFGFVPPPNVKIGAPLLYTLLIALGNVVFILPAFFMMRFAHKPK